MVRGAELAATVAAVYEDPMWQYGFDTLWDGAAISVLLLDEGDLPGFVNLQREYARVAGPGRDVVVVRGALDALMVRIYATMAREELRQTHVCASEAEAWQILAGHASPPAAG
jgi:hypothetical protein